MKIKYADRTIVGEKPIKIHMAAVTILERAQADIEKRIGFRCPLQKIATKAALTFDGKNIDLTCSQFKALTMFTSQEQGGVKISSDAMRHLIKQRAILSKRWQKLVGQVSLAKVMTVAVLKCDYAKLINFENTGNPGTGPQESEARDTTPPASTTDPIPPPVSE